MRDRDPILSLIGDLYTQISDLTAALHSLQEQNASLEAEVAPHREKNNARETVSR